MRSPESGGFEDPSLDGGQGLESDEGLTVGLAFTADVGPTAVGSIEEVVLQTADGIVLSGRWMGTATTPADGAELATPVQEVTDGTATVVLVHGFAGHKNDPKVAELASRLHRSGYAVLTYDARGHGASGGASGVGSAEHLDVAAAVEYAAALGNPVVLMGISMGAVAVVRCLAGAGLAGTGRSASVPEPSGLSQVAGAVLISGPARWRMRPSAVGLLTATMTKTNAGRWAARRWLNVRVASKWRTGEAPESMVRRVRVPLVVVHGTRDRLLAPVHATVLHASAGGPARLEIVDGMGHGSEGAVETAIAGVRWVLGETSAAPALATG